MTNGEWAAEEEKEQYREYQRQREQAALELEHQHEMWEEEQRQLHYIRSEAKELIRLIGGTIYKLMSDKDNFENWLATRPQVIKDLAKKYPPGSYKIKEGSPYGVTSDGSSVEIISYLETGQVGVLIRAEDKSEDALEHEKMLCERYKKSKEETEKIHKSDVTAHVEPEWLELVK